MTLYERTISISKKRGYSLKNLAIKAGLAENSIYDWKKSTPKADNLQKVADVLHVSTDYLLGRTDDMNLPSEIEPTSVEIAGMFRRHSENNNLTNLEKKELVEDLEDYMAMRAKKLSQKRD
ncbi:helix-turn-helix transcriptional regulator [Leuconostoc falkenbergense]|uniref:helix-turn-helix domain-containing protein n=1 Tax=Leuconostoc falkenbergense TaxID=2766470 RepID=UPI0024ADC2C0|nr:helix-turn-helix transcriptional regulator [Leuconostoc falkenbergense]MDI6666459.1 helix-turn-helix transcriptional regulator [Leuconostoc falkenbergense]